MDKNVPPMDAMFFENLVNTIREPLLVLDSDLRVIQANRCFYKTFKVPPEKTAGSLVYDLGNGQWDIPPLRRLLEKILPEESSFDDYEVDHYFPGIGHKTMLLNARRVIREDIGSHLILLAIEDITDRKALKLEVAESEERFRRLFETAKDGLLLLDKKTGRILEANPAITELLGYAGEELIGKELGEFGLLGDKGDFQEVLRIATEWGFFRIDDIPVGTKSGGSTDADVYFVDRAQLLQCNVRDIRERKRADDRFQEITQRLRLATVSGGIGIWDWDIQSNALIWDDRMFELYGVSKDAFKNGVEAWEKGLHPEDNAAATEAFQSAIRGEKELDIEFRVLHPDGRVMFLQANAIAIRDADGKALRMVGMNRDITEHKQAVETLQDNAEKLRVLFEFSPLPILAFSPKGYISLWNPAAERTFGWTEKEVLGVFNPIVPEDGIQEYRRFLERVVKKGRLKGEEVIRRTKDGLLIDVRMTAAALRDSSGAVTGIMSVLENITERKRVEEALRESEEKFRMIFEGSKDGILLADPESKKFYTGNKTICDMLQYSLDEIRQLGVRDIHPEKDLPGILEGFGRQARHENMVEHDIPVKRKDGSVLFVDIKSSPVTVLGKSYLMGNFRDVTERRKTEEMLTRLGMAVDQAAEGIVITDTEGRIEYVNPSFERITGYLLKEAIGQNMRILKSGKQDEKFYKEMWEAISRGEVWRGQLINMKKDGTLYKEESVISPVRNASGKIINFVSGKRDVTQDIMLQKQLQIAQKMEAVGTLAGGIAHDFNNALTGIFGFGEFLRKRVAGDEEALHDLNEIMRSAERAETLTRQLLMFARRQVIEPVNMSLNTLATDLMKLIGKVVGEHIEVKTILAKDLTTVHADRAQIEQVLMNLCLNSRDAMPQGGKLLVETGNVYLDEEYVRQNPYMKTGRFALLEVSDTGIGMDEKTRDRVFEPFFTTKEPEKGTGLGLAMVYGIVKQHNGFINLYSEPGKGTIFKIYLPAIEALPDAVAEKRREETVRGGTETILVAEDEEPIRKLAERILKDLGYNVLLARDGAEAIEILGRNKEIVLAVLDVVMPRMGGKEASKAMRKENPQLKLLFMSGYSADTIHESYVLTDGFPFLQKPFGPTILARKIREVLDTTD